MQKTFFNWSTGKDSALALYYLLQDPNYQVDRLLTSVNADLNRVTMHGLRRELLERQVRELQLPCDTIEIPEKADMESYNALMRKAVEDLKNEGYQTAAFGDIFLEDLRTYRENQLAQLDIGTVFPLWKKDTAALMREFIRLGFKSVVVCVNAQLLDESFVGREIDLDFLNDLPENVDPCGENGEFHTFCFDGPVFRNPVPFEIGDNVYREYPAPNEKETSAGFWFCDLL